MKQKSHMAERECPDDDTLAAFVDRELDAERMADISLHLAACAACRARVGDFATWRLALDDAMAGRVEEEVKDAVADSVRTVRAAALRRRWKGVDEAFSLRREYLAAADGQTADQQLEEMANGSGFLFFRSVSPSPALEGWIVRLARLPHPTPRSVMRFTVLDAAGQPVPSGELKFRGISVPVTDGRANLPLSRLLEHSEDMISLRRGDGAEVPGEPVFDMT